MASPLTAFFFGAPRDMSPSPFSMSGPHFSSTRSASRGVYHLRLRSSLSSLASANHPGRKLRKSREAMVGLHGGDQTSQPQLTSRLHLLHSDLLTPSEVRPHIVLPQSNCPPHSPVVVQVVLTGHLQHVSVPHLRPLPWRRQRLLDAQFLRYGTRRLRASCDFSTSEIDRSLGRWDT